MKQFLTNVSNTINQDFAIPLVSGEIEIKEEKSQAKCQKVILKSQSKQVFAFSLDRNLLNKCEIFPFFHKSTALINKVNDGIVFYINNNQLFVLLVELKSNHLGEYQEQLQAGKVFVYFLLGILNYAFSKNYILEEKNIKCLVFSVRKTARKQGTKRKAIEYEQINGLNIANNLQCHETYYIENFIVR
jgi:hypothetical protein